jgi:hypothetical protein
LPTTNLMASEFHNIVQDGVHYAHCKFETTMHCTGAAVVLLKRNDLFNVECADLTRWTWKIKKLDKHALNWVPRWQSGTCCNMLCAWLPACGMCPATTTSSLTCAAKNTLFITPYSVVIPPYCRVEFSLIHTHLLRRAPCFTS